MLEELEGIFEEAKGALRQGETVEDDLLGERVGGAVGIISTVGLW